MSVTKLTTNGVNGNKYDTVSADNYYMEPIATQLLASATGTITFSNIPQTYKHLQLRVFGKSARASFGDTLFVKANGDTGANYYGHYMIGNGATASAGSYGSTTGVYIGQVAGASANASTFGATIIDILDYSNVYKYKTFRDLDGMDNNDTNGAMVMRSGLWNNTAAITSLSIVTDSGSNFTTNSRFSLYGIRG